MRNAEQPRREPRAVVEFPEILVSLQKYVLAHIERLFPISYDSQQVIVDALLPSRDQEVIGLDISLARLTDQVGIFDRPKNQCSGSLRNDAAGAEKVCKPV